MRTKIDRDAALNFIVCLGAAVVIFGAWAKITHQHFADTMLTIGLFTECAIFLIYGFIPPEKEQKQGIKVQGNNYPPMDTKPIEELNSTLKKVFKEA